VGATASATAGAPEQDYDDSRSSTSDDADTRKPKSTIQRDSLNESQLVADQDAARFELQRRTELGCATEDDSDTQACGQSAIFLSDSQAPGRCCHGSRTKD
jgi:hypothetical protein